MTSPMHMTLIGLGLLAMVSLAGCASTTTGVVVDVVRPSRMEEGGCRDIHLVYLDRERVLPAEGVRLSASARQMIAEEIRRLLHDTGYIKSTTVPSDVSGDDYHEMVVKVTTFEVKNSTDGTYLRKTAYVDLSLVLKEGGLNECYSITPPTHEHKRQVPAHRDQELPSDAVLLRQAVRETLADVISTFVPRKVKTLRPVRGLSGELGRAANLLKSGNCDDALQLLKRYLQQKPEDANALYNAGAAAECLSTNERDQKRKERALQVAVDYYKQVLASGKTDAETQRARREAQQTLAFYERVLESGAATRKQSGALKGPKGF